MAKLQVIMDANEIFNTQAYFNKWLKELTDDEKEHIISMMNEFHQAKSIEEGEARYWDAINWSKIHDMEYPGNLSEAIHIASGREKI
jgi:hypothetical protein